MTLQNNNENSLSVNSDGFSIGAGTSTRTLTLSGADFPVLLASPSSNNVLRYNGTNWVNGNTPLNITSNFTYINGTLDLGTSLTVSTNQFTILGNSNYGLLHLVSSGTNQEASVSFWSNNVGSNGSGAWDVGANVVPSLSGTGNLSIFNSGLGAFSLIINANNNYISIGKQGSASYPLDVNGTINTSSIYSINGTAIRLENLANVVTVNETIGDELMFNGTNWINSPNLSTSSSGTSTTSSTTFQNKINYTTGSLQPGIYQIGWSYIYSYSTVARNFAAQILANSGTVYTHTSSTNTGALGAGAVGNLPSSGFVNYTLASSGTLNVQLMYAATNTGDTATIANAYLEVMRIQ